MLTMTRLPSASFLPRGIMIDPNEQPISFSQQRNASNSTSVISPLSLPHGINHLSYFDDPHLHTLPPPHYSYPPVAFSVASRSRQYLSPGPSPPAGQTQRSSSLSPTRFRSRSSIGSPSLPPTSNPSVAPSLDSMSSQSATSLLQRKEDHIRRLQQSWEEERTVLEASRKRAEDVYKEERDMMDDERHMWAVEKARLEAEMLEWRRRAESAESERDQLARTLKNAQHGSSTHVGSSFDGTTDVATEGRRGGSSASPGVGPLPTVKFQSPSGGVSPGGHVPQGLGHGSTMPDSKPFEPLDPRMQVVSADTHSPNNEQQERVPSIDIHEIIPELEGVRLKTTAVQRPTFMDGKSLSPADGSKKASPLGSPSGSNKGSPNARSRTSPAELTKEALQAPESHRLTMHAGHTPNHSMSLSRLATVTSTRAPNTAGSSGASTPRRQTRDERHDDGNIQSVPSQPTVAAGTSDDLLGANIDAQEAQMESSEEDPELQEPLVLRNFPAADEVFLRRLNDKLERFRTDEITREDMLESSDEAGPSEWVRQEAGGPAPSVQTATNNEEDAQDNGGEVGEDIPLKMKKTTNFGLPFGQLGRPSRA